jgi:dihydrofolate reductase
MSFEKVCAARLPVRRTVAAPLRVRRERVHDRVLSLPWWGADGPTGERRLQVFVLTYAEPEKTPPGVYAFATDGIGSAVRRANATAGDKDVDVSGAEVGRQSIGAGLVDKSSMRLVPVLIGSGTRMFGHPGDERIQPATVEAIETAAATHPRFRSAR